MSNIIRRTEEDQRIARDPFRWMRELMGWDPFRETTQWMGPSNEATFAPAFEVKETKDSFQFKADLPGIKEDDVEVKLTANRLTVSGKRDFERQDKNDTYYTYERSYGTFQRTFAIPEGLDTDHAVAELKDGVLTIALPKKANAQTKTISVKAGDKAKS